MNVVDKEQQGEGNIRDDIYIKGLLDRLPLSERGSFSDHQLNSLRSALGAGTWRTHPVDLRWTLSIWKKRYYFVFLSGVNKRPVSRRQQELAVTGKALLLTSLLGVSIVLGLLLLYLAKSAAGINLFPGFSLGIWDWFQQL